MKKNAQYEINFDTNTIVVTRQFLNAAKQIGTPEFRIMMELRDLNMDITERVIRRTHREDRWSYERMMRFIRCTTDGESYMEDFNTLRTASNYMKVWAWFKETFPNYMKHYEMDGNHRIVVTPVGCDKASIRAFA